MKENSVTTFSVSRSRALLGMALFIAVGLLVSQTALGDGGAFPPRGQVGQPNDMTGNTAPEDPRIPTVPSEGVYDSGLLELGDGQPPPGMSGLADIVSNPEQAGPDWADLFTADGSARDEYPYDEAGLPLGNGVPDYVELHRGRWAVFGADDVSLGTGWDGTIRAADGVVVGGVALASNDIGNVYVYSTVDAAEKQVIYAAAERLAEGDSVLEFEFSQDHLRLGHGGYGVGRPWKLQGTTRDFDVLVRLTFSGGLLASADASVWIGGAWSPLTSVVGEGCDDSEWLCALSNAVAIDGGPWTNFDTGADPEQISAHRFVELGLNVGALLGTRPYFRTITVRTPEDLFFGYFEEGR